ADETSLARLAAPAGGRIDVLQVARHRNKLRLGHLHGNRFRLGLAGGSDSLALGALRESLERLSRSGVENRFGAQRFGIGGANLAVARAWASGDPARAAELCVDSSGGWRIGDALPSEFRPGLFGRVVGALRRASDPERALRAAGRGFAKLLASAAQSAVFNAVLDARRDAGLTHRARAGDVLRRRGGGLFRCADADVDSANERAAPGRLEVTLTGPLPGADLYLASPAVDAEERRWSEPALVDWGFFSGDGPLASPGDRRELVVPFLEAPRLEVAGEITWLDFALPPGSFATEVLTQCAVAGRV
ncbi:MAG: tRNA pseudouridine(13) synthase TruD, partial [Myxococcota bacterium]